jgi:hypothetical protein
MHCWSSVGCLLTISDLYHYKAGRVVAASIASRPRCCSGSSRLQVSVRLWPHCQVARKLAPYSATKIGERQETHSDVQPTGANCKSSTAVCLRRVSYRSIVSLRLQVQNLLRKIQALPSAALISTRHQASAVPTADKRTRIPTTRLAHSIGARCRNRLSRADAGRPAGLIWPIA